MGAVALLGLPRPLRIELDVPVRISWILQRLAHVGVSRVAVDGVTIDPYCRPRSRRRGHLDLPHFQFCYDLAAGLSPPSHPSFLGSAT